LREVHDRAGTLIDFAFRSVVADVWLKPDELMERIAAVKRDDIQQVAEKIEFDTIYFLRNRQQATEVR